MLNTSLCTITIWCLLCYLYYENNDYWQILFFLSFFNIVIMYKTLLFNIHEQNCIVYYKYIYFNKCYMSKMGNEDFPKFTIGNRNSKIQVLISTQVLITWSWLSTIDYQSISKIGNASYSKRYKKYLCNRKCRKIGKYVIPYSQNVNKLKMYFSSNVICSDVSTESGWNKIIVPMN